MKPSSPGFWSPMALRVPAAVSQNVQLPLARLDDDSLLARLRQVQVRVQDGLLLRAGLAQDLAGRRHDLATADEPPAPLYAYAVRRHNKDAVLPGARPGEKV